MSQPPDSTVAIVMGTYNGARFIQEQLDSIIGQTYSDWRLLVRDDGSSDDTTAIIERAAQADPRIERVQDTQGNLGPALNFSALCAIARARGFAYVFFADQDDVWHPDKITRSLTALRTAEAGLTPTVPLLLHTDLAVVDEHRQPIAASLMRYKRLSHVEHDPLRMLLIQNSVTGCTMACNRALLELATPIPATAIMHDWWFALCAATFGEILYLDAPTIDYRQHGRNQIGARRRLAFPNPIRRDAMHTWRNGLILFQRRIEQSRDLLRRGEHHPPHQEAEGAIREFLDLASTPSSLRRVIKTVRRRFNSRLGPGHTLLMLSYVACLKSDTSSSDPPSS